MLAERYLSDTRAAEVLGRDVMNDEVPGQHRFIRQQAAKRSPAAVPDRSGQLARAGQHGFGQLWERAVRWARSRSGRRQP